MNTGSAFLYFDNNATTEVDPEVMEEMLPYLTKWYGNPSSSYRFGKVVAQAIETARERVAELIGSHPQEIVFTSCGTESTNAAIHAALATDRDRQHIVTTRVEHSATLKTCEGLARKGYEVTWLGVNERGQLDLAELENAIKEETALVTIMWANNETGTLFPMEEIQNIICQKGVFFHTDAVQVVGKLSVNVTGSAVQFLSLSGHKLHCPKGIGALFVNRKSRFTSFMTGGGQENGRRAGTENVASIVGLGKACEIAGRKMEAEGKRIRVLRDTFERLLVASVEGIEINGDVESRLANTSNVSFKNVDGETLLLLLDKEGLCCSAGSACTSGSIAGSHVLKAMGFSEERLRRSLRFSFSRMNTEHEIPESVKRIASAVAKIRSGAGIQ